MRAGLAYRRGSGEGGMGLFSGGGSRLGDSEVVEEDVDGDKHSGGPAERESVAQEALGGAEAGPAGIQGGDHKPHHQGVFETVDDGR